MLTTYYVSGKIEFNGMFPFGYDGTFYREHRVKLYMGSAVTNLDTAKKSITLANGDTLQYDSCLIATGASPLMPRIQGINSPKVFAMRSVEDAIKLKEALKRKPKKAVVVGASMVGIKVVELLIDAGLQVCLADLASCLFPLAAHEECANIIEKTLTSRGVELKFGAGIEGIEETENGVRALFGKESAVDADLVVMCIGVRANISFINRDQIEIDRGILVDDQMRTSCPDVYAAGDVSQGSNILTKKKQIIGLWTNARYQGRTAGKNMAGIPDTYRGNIPHNITHFMDMVFTGLGDPHGGDKHKSMTNSRAYTQLTFNNQQLVGVNMLGESCSSIGIIKTALEKKLINNEILDEDMLCSQNLKKNLLYNYFRREKA
jgi:3-phenylpropionate/trans-cinnamate dioxygenase ferredoxin reductase subunit